MAQYDNTNRFTLFKNKKKEKDTHADFEGTLNVNGEEFWINAWIKTSQKDGGKFMSGSIKPKQGRQPASRPAQKPRDPDLDPADEPW